MGFITQDTVLATDARHGVHPPCAPPTHTHSIYVYEPARRPYLPHVALVLLGGRDGAGGLLRRIVGHGVDGVRPAHTHTAFEFEQGA